MNREILFRAKGSGKSMWESNPWVAVYSFELVD